MRTPANIAGHPIHPMLVPIAIGGFLLSFAFDLVCWFTGSTPPNTYTTVAYYTMLPAGPIKSTAIRHMSINLVIVALFVVNAWMRHSHPDDLKVPMLLSLVAVLLLLVSGWLGGKLVYEAGIGVDAHP